ncbi:MAG: response regulator [Candidatus Omnitrophica bacterium]|nr:response regulator [Candidatus Omnitrophota bacterium]
MKTILVVEDNKDLRDILKKRLEYEGYLVNLAEDGYVLLGSLRSGKEPDAIILDLMLPGRSGVELLGTLTSTWKMTKIYIFSAHPEYQERHGLKNYDIAGYFLKSDGIDNLITTIKEDLEGTEWEK